MPPDTLSGIPSDSTLGSSAAIDALSASHATDRANLEAQQQAQVDQLTRSQNTQVTAVGKPGAAPAPAVPAPSSVVDTSAASSQGGAGPGGGAGPSGAEGAATGEGSSTGQGPGGSSDAGEGGTY